MQSADFCLGLENRRGSIFTVIHQVLIMNRSIVFCAWAGQVAMYSMFASQLFFWHLLPPPSPSLPLDEWAAHFTGNINGVFIGSIFMMFGSSLFMVFFGGLFSCLKKMEGKNTPLTYCMLMIIPFGFFPLFAMLVFLVEAAFRPGASIEIIGMLADLALFMLVIPGFVGLVQWVVTGVIILGDVNEKPIFPRWTGYANIWVGTLSLPGCLIPFFKSGPFSWNGIFTFWIPAIVFGIMLTILTWAMIRAARHPAMSRL